MAASISNRAGDRLQVAVFRLYSWALQLGAWARTARTRIPSPVNIDKHVLLPKRRYQTIEIDGFFDAS